MKGKSFNAGSCITVIVLTVSMALVGGCDRFRNYTDIEYVQRAKDAQAKGDLKAAVIELKNALGKNANNAEARWLLGEAYLDLGQGAAAEKELARAKALGLNPQTLILPFAKAYLLQRQYQKVLDEVQPGPQFSASNTAQFLKYQGDANWGLRHFKEACDLYGQSSKTDAQKPEAYWGLAECAVRIEHDTQKARSYLNQALRLGQRQDETWVLIGNWESSQNKSKEAEAAYAQALKLNPKNTQALFSDAMFLLSARKFDAAKNHADTLRKISPDSPAAIFLDSFSAYLRKDYPTALDALQKLEKRDPNLPSVLLLGASVNYATGALASSEQYVDRYLAVYPRNIAALKLRAKILLKTARAAEAIKVLQPLLAQLTDQEVYVLAAEAYSSLHQYAPAAEWLEKAVALDPKNVPIQVALGRDYFALGQDERAVALLENASRADVSRPDADITLVVYYLSGKQYDKARATVLALEKKQPANPLVQDLKGSILLAQGDIANARASYEKALAIQPDYFLAALHLAQLDLRDKNTDAARQRFLGILNKDPNNLQAMLALSEIALVSRDEDAYVKWLEKATKANPTALEPRARLARYYLGQNKPQQALVIAREAQIAIPDNLAALDLLGSVQLAAGEKENALASFNQILARHPNAIPYLIRVASIQGSMGHPADARATLSNALKIAPDNADVYAALATLDLVDGKPEQALTLARQMQQRKLLVPEGDMLEGDILMRQGKYAAAVQPYRAAFALRKDGLSAISVHQSMVLSGRAGEADQQLLQWLAQQPAEVQARVYLASSLAQRGLIKAAIQQYEIVLTHAPKNVAALNNLAVLYQQDHDPRAVASAEKAHQLNPDDPAVADTLGWILVEGGGDLKRGTTILKQAITGAPRSASIRYHYAVALWKGGDNAGARKELDAALKTGGAFPEQGQAKALRAKL